MSGSGLGSHDFGGDLVISYSEQWAARARGHGFYTSGLLNVYRLDKHRKERVEGKSWFLS